MKKFLLILLAAPAIQSSFGMNNQIESTLIRNPTENASILHGAAHMICLHECQWDLDLWADFHVFLCKKQCTGPYKKFCTGFLQSFINQQKSLMTFLACMRKRYPKFYGIKDMRKFVCSHMFYNNLSPAKTIHALLNLKNSKGKTLYDLCPVEAFHPTNWSFDKFEPHYNFRQAYGLAQARRDKKRHKKAIELEHSNL